MGQEEVHFWLALVPVKVHPHRNYCYGQCHPEHGVFLEFPGEPEYQWPEDVELLFYPQAPEMEQGFCCRGVVEVAFLKEKHEVGDEPRTTGYMLAKLHVFIGKEIEPAET